MKVDIKKLVTSFLIVAMFVLIESIITKGTMGYYSTLIRPPFAPKPIVFPIAWTILYILIAYTIYKSYDDKPLFYYLIFSLLVNIIWPILFFKFKLLLFSTIWLGFLVLLVLISVLWLFKKNKVLGYLNIIYLAWTLFALYLNISIYILNK